MCCHAAPTHTLHSLVFAHAYVRGYIFGPLGPEHELWQPSYARLGRPTQISQLNKLVRVKSRKWRDVQCGGAGKRNREILCPPYPQSVLWGGQQETRLGEGVVS